ncbi:hypothetical protein SATMO3_12540 [Sporomusa aerivorans]
MISLIMLPYLYASDNNVDETREVNKMHIVFKGYHIRYTDIKWESDSTLIIYHNYNDGVIKSETDNKGIKIKYAKAEKPK